MRLDKKPFINYNDNHIPFSDEDIWHLAMMSQNEIPFHHSFLHGEGMQSILNDESIENLLDISVRAEDESEAMFKFDTLVIANPGETISGDVIADLIEESKKTGMPLAKLMQNLYTNVKTFVIPGDGVPEIAPRSQTKRNK